jgi:hypothetical protein
MFIDAEGNQNEIARLKVYVPGGGNIFLQVVRGAQEP